MPAKRPAEERFWEKVQKSDGCWEWTAYRNQDGYGQFSAVGRRVIGAHRFAYELLVGEIPDGLHLDHLCRNPACVRPEHLEPVTPKVNTQRGILGFDHPMQRTALSATHCPHGHEFTEANTAWRITAAGTKSRRCRECQRAEKRGKPRTSARRVTCPDCGAELRMDSMRNHRKSFHDDPRERA
jgi:hypothetical protein